MKLRIGVLSLLALWLVCAPAVFSQTITTADVAGVITDASGAVVPNATVTIRNEDTNDTRTAMTNESGQYRFSLLPPGNYVISAATSGLKSNTQKVRLNVGQ